MTVERNSQFSRSGDMDVKWQLTEVVNPDLQGPVQTITAKDILYLPHGNRFQTLNIYLPVAANTLKFIDTPITTLLPPSNKSQRPFWHVHIHGGAWRDPNLTASSIEPTVAYAFSQSSSSNPIIAIASINYTLSPFPTHPVQPYDPIKDNHSDPSCRAVHPQHIHDVLMGLQFLKSMGLNDDLYILLGHSAGACICSQAIFQQPEYWGSRSTPPPRPAAFLGFNGLYDLPALVNGLGASYEHLKDVYDDLVGHAFGMEKSKWSAPSPTYFEIAQLEEQRVEGRAPAAQTLTFTPTPTNTPVRSHLP
ncbi:hypothetical protein BGZ60DRAFT_537525 [Tricladium varicosporioides]|nr:hypothetical protein BGZ60DRAFT_537525 [Hymenoscyphus varicosporioides]